MAKQVDSTNIGTLLEALITKIKSFFWRKDETSELPIDNTPTSGSNNLVKSGGVYSSLQGIRQLKVLNLGNFYPSDGEVTLGTKSEAASALNITEAQLDLLCSGEYDCIEFGGAYGGFKTQAMAPILSGYMCIGMNAHYLTMPFLLGFFKHFDEDVYSYQYSPLGINDVTVGGESVVNTVGGSGIAVIPAIPDVSQFITRSVNDLANYYLKSETYTKDEVASLIGAIQQFHYEIAASTSAVTNPSNNVLYLIGPTGSGADKYEEYVYDATKPVAERWVKIGDTTIDLSGYVTTDSLNTALAGYVTSGALQTALAGKQDKIDASHKLDYSLLENTPTIPAAQVPADWNATEGVSRILNKPTIPTQYAGSPTAGGFANKAVAIPFGSVDAGSTDTEITATVDNFPTTLTDGVCAFIRNNVVSSASGFTLNINGTGAKPVYQTLADASRVSTVFNANSTYLFIYNSTRVEGGCWDLYYGYNSNDNTIGYNLRTNAMSLPTTSACYRYRLLFTSADRTHFVPANASSSTSATAKKDTTQTPIDPFGSIRYYSYTTAVSSGNRPGATYLWEQYLVTLGYSFNRTGAALTLTPWEPVYIMCMPQPDGSAIIVSGTPYVQSLPTTNDGYIYIYLGVATSATQVEVVFHHPVYYHDGTCIKLWTGPTYKLQHHSDTNNGVTRESFLWADVQKAMACKEFDIVDNKYGILVYAHLTIVSMFTNYPIYSFVSIDEGGLTLLPFYVEMDSQQTSEPASLTYGNTLYTYDSATQSFVYEHASS